MKVLRLLIATPSRLDQSRLVRSLAQCADVQVIGGAHDLAETFRLCEAQEPDVVLISQDFVQRAEFETLKDLLYAVNSFWVPIGNHMSGGLESSTTKDVMIRAGSSPDEITSAMKKVLAIRNPRTFRPGRIAPGLVMPRSSGHVILIGASTGGVDALLALLSTFPEDCPPTAIVQHTGAGFSDSLVRLIGRKCVAQVCAAEHGLPLRAGRICVAAGTAGHLRVSESGGSFRTSLTKGEPISGHVPSVDALFASAVPFAKRVVAALLTGMGRDGAAGLLSLRQAGARTIGQDETSSVVYGMPRAAFEMGAVQRQLSLPDIGPEILRLCATGAPSRAGAQ
jgi:two-component system, chemotaxis family, protein-glutamate methylesterase/glutaminase